METPHPTAFLIDGTAFCYQAFYAIRTLSTTDGRPTNAVYGFALMLNALRKTQHPTYLAVAFDVGKPTFRHERFEAYKEFRKPMPDLLVAQLPLIKELLAAYRIPTVELAGYEGEDLLATLAKRIASPRVEVFLVTGDKDMLQVVGPWVKVYNPHKDHAIYDEQKVVERYGVPPNRIVDLMALMGDEIDNIPGVPGIGQKTATTLLQQFGTLEGLYERLGEITTDSLRTTLRQHREQVQLARELAQIDTEVPISVGLSELAVSEPDWVALRRLLRQLEFKRLLAEADAAMPPVRHAMIQVRIVQDQQTAESLCRAICTSEQPVAVASFRRPQSQSGLFVCANQTDEAWIIPLDATLPPWLEPFGRWLASPEHPKVGHDLKHTLRWLQERNVDLDGIADDTSIIGHLLNPAKTNPTLSELAEEHLDIRLPQRSLDQPWDDESSWQSLGYSACATLQLTKVFAAELERAGLLPLYRELELPLVRVLADMEAQGVAIDLDQLAALRGQMGTRLAQLGEELYTLVGSRVNLNSPRQLAEVLFQQFKLPVIKRTKTGPSTDSEVLTKLAAKHPFPQKLLEYRELSKLLSTYLEVFPKLINPATHRLHTSFHQTGTATGRLSSSEPNLQNIPIKTELGRQIRRAFIPREKGWILLAADYSQIELRILAHLSGDPGLLEAFRQDRDIHRHTASLVYRIPEAEVMPQMRSAMKVINYGIIYGMSAHGLSKELGIPNEEAAAFIEAYFARYPKVQEFLEAQRQSAKRDGYVQTLLGRRRFIPEVNSPDIAVRQFGERMAVNAPIQGTAADLIKRSMVQIWHAIRTKQLASRMILQVHDELVFECPPHEPRELASLVKDTMEHALELIVPLQVVVKIGPNWLDLAPIP